MTSALRARRVAGSTFTLEVPVQAAGHSPTGLPTHQPVTCFAPASILIIDDRADNRELLRQYLRDQPFTIIEAGDGAVRQAAADLRAAAGRFDPSALTQRIEALQRRAGRRPAVSAA